MPSIPGSRPTGVVMGISLVPPSDGSRPVGLVKPGAKPVGLVNAGLVSAGLTAAPGVGGSVVPGRAKSPGIPGVRPGVVRPGLVRPGLVKPGLVNPGLVNPGLMPVPVPPVRLGTGGRLIPNEDKPCDSAVINSVGRSATLAARTNSWCSVGLVSVVDS